VGEVERAALLRQVIAGRRTLRRALVEWIRRWFAAAESFRDADRARFVREFTPVAIGAQRSSASLMWAYESRVLADLSGDLRAPAPIQVDTVSGEALRGVPPETVYARPFTEIYRQLSEDKSLTEAVTAGERRAMLIGVTDLELAEREAARQVLAGDDRAPAFYRRGLTGDENCAMCIVASTQRYRTGELMPIHPGCDCVVEPIPGDRDPGQVLNEQLLERAHEAIVARFGISDRSGREIDYRKLLLVREHGEFGPVLTVARHLFTGPDGVPAPRPA
jgi:hypothetical protein